MKCTLALCFAALIGSATISAQQTVYGTAHPGYGIAGMENVQPFAAGGNSAPNEKKDSCLVGMRASQGIDGQLLKSRRSAPATSPKSVQRIQLILSGAPGGKQIVAGSVMARGLSPRGRIVSAVGAKNIANGVQTTLNVKFTAGENGSARADLLLPGFSSVSSIHLNSITYADGSVWKIPSVDVCRVVPDPLVLVAGR